MQEFDVELSVGDAVQIGEYTLTVVDVDGPEVSFRIDPVEDEFAPGPSAELKLPH